MAFGDNERDARIRTAIRRVRQQRGFTQAELARRTEIHPSTISSLENGHIKLYPGHVRRIAKAFGTSVAKLEEAQR